MTNYTSSFKDIYYIIIVIDYKCSMTRMYCGWVGKEATCLILVMVVLIVLLTFVGTTNFHHHNSNS